MFAVNRWLLIWAFAYAGFVARSASAKKDGIVNVAGSCASCHGGAPSDTVSVSIDGPTELVAGEQADYVVRIQGGPLAAAGFNIQVRPWGAATLLAGPESRLESNELTHGSPLLAVDDSVEFAFRLRAGNDAVSLTLLAAGNSVDLSDTSQGDMWNRASLQVNVVGDTEGPAGDAEPATDSGAESLAESAEGGCAAGYGGALASFGLLPWFRRRAHRQRCFSR